MADGRDEFPGLFPLDMLLGPGVEEEIALGVFQDECTQGIFCLFASFSCEIAQRPALPAAGGSGIVSEMEKAQSQNQLILTL